MTLNCNLWQNLSHIVGRGLCAPSIFSSINYGWAQKPRPTHIDEIRSNTEFALSVINQG